MPALIRFVSFKDFSGISKIPFCGAKDSAGYFKDSKDSTCLSDTCQESALAIVYSANHVTRPPLTTATTAVGLPPPSSVGGLRCSRCEGGEQRAGQAPRLLIP